MENNKHRLVVVSYELYSIENGEEQFLEKTEDMQPMQLYTGCDMALPAFEQEIVKFEKTQTSSSLSLRSRLMGSMTITVF